MQGARAKCVGYVVVPGCCRGGTWCGPSPGPDSAGGHAVNRVPVISSPRSGDMEWFGRNPTGSIRCSVAPQCGDHDGSRARVGLRPSRCSPRFRQATDLAVAQAMENEGEELARSSHAPDLGAATLADAAVVPANHRVAVLAGDGLDGGPTHEP